MSDEGGLPLTTDRGEGNKLESGLVRGTEDGPKTVSVLFSPIRSCARAGFTW